MPAYKDEKTNTWMARFYYSDDRGNRKQKKKRGFKRKSDALEYEREFLLKLDGSAQMTFQTLFEDYFEDMKPRLRPATISRKKYIFRDKLLPYLGHYAITEIDEKVVRRWQNQLLQQKKTDGNKYSQTYLRGVNNEFSAIMNYAVKFYKLPYNPVRRAGTIGRKHADGIQFWTLDEFNQAMKYFEGNEEIEFRTMYYLLFYSGMRLGEMKALTIKDFDFKNNLVSITKSYARVDGKVYINKPKTVKSEREITLPLTIIEMIKEYISKLYDVEENTLIFPSNKSSISRRLKTAARNTGVKEIRTHDLRHSHVALLIEMDINTLVIQDRLGHEDIQTTLNTYGHLYPNKQEEVAESLNKLLSPI